MSRRQRARSAPPRTDRLILRVAFWLMLLSAVFLLGMAANDFRANLRAGRWPTVAGTITDLHTHKILVGRFLPLQTRVDAAYDYSVHAITYRGSRLVLGALLPPGIDPRGLAIGSVVTVHYNPEDPGEAVLYLNGGISLTVYGGVAVIFLAVGLVLRRYSDAGFAPTRDRRRGSRK